MTDTERTTTEPAQILVVDDDPIMRELAVERLRAAGHHVRIATNGAEGLNALAPGDIDLVVSDLDMPVMGGFEMLRSIRANESLHDIPVIVVTGSEHRDSVDEAFEAGATSFLAKPINWTLFGRAVMFILKASRDQRALRAARDQAEAGARFKDGLMSVMSHELRTPLNAIIGFGQILRDQFDRENDHLHKEYADYVVDSGKRLLNSVSDMLLASDARSGPIAINETDCTVAEIAEHAQTVSQRVITDTQATLALALEDPDLELCCDLVLVSRALGKLIENSTKFSPRGVRIVLGAAMTKTGELAFLVEDNGPGIAADKLATIVQPFAQSDLSTRRSKEGLGLGVPLVQAIATAHDAKFRIESSPGNGTRALLLMPQARMLTPRRASAQHAATG